LIMKTVLGQLKSAAITVKNVWHTNINLVHEDWLLFVEIFGLQSNVFLMKNIKFHVRETAWRNWHIDPSYLSGWIRFCFPGLSEHSLFTNWQKTVLGIDYHHLFYFNFQDSGAVLNGHRHWRHDMRHQHYHRAQRHARCHNPFQQILYPHQSLFDLKVLDEIKVWK
jgi:hypothetical protein